MARSVLCVLWSAIVPAVVLTNGDECDLNNPSGQFSYSVSSVARNSIKMHDGIGLLIIDKFPPEYPLPHDPVKATWRAHTICDQR